MFVCFPSLHICYAHCHGMAQEATQFFFMIKSVKQMAKNNKINTILVCSDQTNEGPDIQCLSASFPCDVLNEQNDHSKKQCIVSTLAVTIHGIAIPGSLLVSASQPSARPCAVLLTQLSIFQCFIAPSGVLGFTPLRTICVYLPIDKQECASRLIAAGALKTNRNLEQIFHIRRVD